MGAGQVETKTPPHTKGCATLLPCRAYRLDLEAKHLGVATRLPDAQLTRRS